MKESTLKPFEFYFEEHQIIYKTMKKLDAAEEPVDPVTIISKLDSDTIEKIGNVSYLVDLVESVPSTETFNYYQKIVSETFKVRKSIQLCNSYQRSPNIDLLNQLIANLNGLIEEENVSFQSNKEILYEIYEELYNPKSGLSGIDSGFTDLNKMTDGFQKGNLIVLAARPSVGKTALALNFAMNACKSDTKVIFFAFEMSANELNYRLMSSLANVDSMFLRKGKEYLTDEELGNAVTAMGIIDDWDFRISDNNSRQTVYDICQNVRSQVRQDPNQDFLVIIDYLQLIKTDKTINRHDLQIGEITRELKLLAKELNIPIILLSQLNRGVVNRTDKRPQMSDLRDSGNIEQDADVIILLHRDDYYDRDSENKNIIEVNIAKQRNGPVGAVELVFLKEKGKFLDLAKGS
ncbi:replicative DNA helicase [Priestia flexa]|uniref:replicative DNA helicase n=1 Tax=Priestia flexa TaxID=86664 RepID=UPI002DBC94E8|nr:replicative DNA helicase [Priestia flexa]MEC0664827.1 replicative DNA helicase [Priestia flexa]